MSELEPTPIERTIAKAPEKDVPADYYRQLYVLLAFNVGDSHRAYGCTDAICH